MPGQNETTDRQFGNAITIPKISVTWIGLTGVGVLGLTAAFYFGDKHQQDTLTFFVLTAALGAGCMSAYYAWQGLKTSIRQRREALEEEKRKVSLQFMTRWNDGNMAATRLDWQELASQIDEQGEKLWTTIPTDSQRRATVAAVLNFMEEMGYAAKSGSADICTLESLFRGLCLQHMRRARPWIEYRRKENTRAWANFEWLCDQWKMKP